MRLYELDEGFVELFKKPKPTGPQLMNHADVEMIQSVDRRARSTTKEVYNLKSSYGNERFVYVKYLSSYEFRVILPTGATKSFRFKTASELHQIFHRVNQLLHKKNGT